ncbi:ribosomal-processing cysteine protease Prp [Oceanobacillus piezotolerans]|uniref:Ribosomal processing cysteine protease Prp n=1 Tax=Oceanobacillus piezotolerans TaxID=2448030 RepID=A0A498DFJ3_9BACI|nr:ribosomal-processing cysteine protease Prp [Oceanobacillus piezotolerans]RLL47968.1 ribosomal-processing cysteine protease Prp [Oceanobacillus piezotolerans]
MITVTVYREDNRITAFKLSGHAESGPYGYDLVCAGVSAVSIGTVNAVTELCHVPLEIEQGAEGGYLYVSIPSDTDSEIMNQVQLLFEGMLVSLKSIELEYGKFIKINTK